MFEFSGFEDAAVVGDLAGSAVGLGATALAGYVQGTTILTPSGARAVETLGPGDLVMTCDTGITRILWTHACDVPGRGPAAPVVFAAGAMGNEREVSVAQHQGVLLRSPLAELWFAAHEVLVPAKALVNGRDIVVKPRRKVAYHSLLLPRHDVLFADGMMVESLLYADTTAEVVTRQGDVVSGAALRHTHAVSARRVLTAHEARVLMEGV